MIRKTSAAIRIAMMTVVIMTGRPGTAAADINGFNWVNPGVTVSVGQAFSITLGKNTFAASFNCCFAPNPHVVWGDGNLDPNAAVNQNNVSWSCGFFRADDCELNGAHRYDTAGVFVVHIYYNAGFLWFEARFPIVVREPVPAIVPDAPESFVLVSVGDSAASGEGVPDSPLLPWAPAVWSDGLGLYYGQDPKTEESKCHRSRWSHPVQLVERLERENPGTQFTMLHLACTGNETGQVAQQIVNMNANLPAGMEVDALLISAGANDQFGTDAAGKRYVNGFAPSVMRCLDPSLPSAIDCGVWDSFLRDGLDYKFSDGLMENRYDDIERVIEDTGRRVGRAYITEYFDPTKDAHGQFGNVFDALWCTGDGIWPSEWAFLYDKEVLPLNNVVAKAAGVNNWTVIDTIPARFVNHGYCAVGQSWVLSAFESLGVENELNGTAHPNHLGQAAMADEVYEHLLRDQPPHTTATLTHANDTAYVPGTWTNQLVDVLLRGRNLRGAGASRLTWSLKTNTGTVLDGGVVDEHVDVTTNHSLTMHVLQVYGDGEYEIVFHSTNWHGVAEADRSVSVLFDSAPPSTSANLSPSGNGGGWNTTNVTVNLSASDLAGSGLHSITYTLSGAQTGVSTVYGAIASATITREGTTTLTYFGTDNAGNVERPQTVVIRIDKKPPVFDPTTLTFAPFAAENAAGAHANFVIKASDAMAASVPVSCTRSSGSVFPIGVTTITCTADDTHGNTVARDVQITVQDMTPPIVTVGPDQWVTAETPVGAHVSFTASAIDAVDGPVPSTCDSLSGSLFPFGFTTVTCSAEDARHNKGARAFKVHVGDGLGPAIDGPPYGVAVFDEESPTGGRVWLASTQAACDGLPPPGNSRCVTLSAIDKVFGPEPLFCEGMPIASTPIVIDFGLWPVGRTSITCSSSDGAGNTTTEIFRIQVVDRQPPAILGLPGDITDYAGPDGTADFESLFDNLAISVIDNVDAITFVAPPTVNDWIKPGEAACRTMPVDGDYFWGIGRQFALGQSYVECYALDRHFNLGIGIFFITVTPPRPNAYVTSGPELFYVDPTDTTSDLFSPSRFATFTFEADMTATFECQLDGDGLAPCDSSISFTGLSIGPHLFEVAGVNGNGQGHSASFDWTIADRTGPSLIVPPNLAAEAAGVSGVPISFNVSATDDFDPSVAPTCSSPSGSMFPLGATVVTCSATDQAGNATAARFTVTVRDTTPPVVTVPQTTIVRARDRLGAAVAFQTSASDFVDHTDPVICLPASGSTFPLGITQVNCTATDTHANVGSASFLVDIVDDLAPVITAPANITVDANGSNGATLTAAAIGVATAIDAVGPITITRSPAGNLFPLGTSGLVWTATDAAGNSSSASQLVTVTTPACVTATPTVTDLLPADHRVVPVGIAGVTNVTIANIYQDEPTNNENIVATSIDGGYAGNCSPVLGIACAPGVAYLRAERGTPKPPPSNGRVYHIRFTGMLANGASCNGDVTVAAPPAAGTASIDNGPRYDSTVARKQ